MNLEIVKSEKDFLEVSFEGDAHTILNLVKRKLIENKSVEFAGYNKPHPLINKSTLVIRSKENPKALLKKAIDEIIKDLKSLNIK